MSAGASAPTVLVVDDDPDILATVRQILELEGYGVLSARNGAEALAVLGDHSPDVIVLDLMMPVMDGWEFRRQMLLGPDPDIPVIIVSADREIARKAQALRASSFIAKPFDITHLLDEVGKYVAPVA